MREAVRLAWMAVMGVPYLAGCGATEHDDPASAGGSSGGAMCNDLELLDVEPSCSELVAVPTPTGGQIAEGVYALVDYAIAGCAFGNQRTLRIAMISDDTYALELVVGPFGGRANEVFVTSGTTITSMYTCGGDTNVTQLGYSVADGAEAYQLSVSSEASVFTYRRVGD